MNFIDMHCDTIWKLLDLGGSGDLYDNDGDISIRKMQKGGTLAQFFACFIYQEHMKGNTPEEKYENGYERALAMAAFLKQEIGKYADQIAFAGTPEEMEKNRKDGKISAVLTVEEGGILNGKIERLEELYRAGIRLMTLTWNYENCIGYPNHTSPALNEKGLKPFGIEAVERMNDLGMIVDISHASDGVIRDVLAYSKKPAAASHSNCRALCNHQRNLTDEFLRELGEKGGVAGLNFYGAFLGDKTTSRIEEMVAHIQHMINVGGSDLPAIGTDFDGMEYLDIPDAGEMPRLWDALEKAGVTASQIDKICYGNVKRLWEAQR